MVCHKENKMYKLNVYIPPTFYHVYENYNLRLNDDSIILHYCERLFKVCTAYSLAFAIRQAMLLVICVGCTN